MGAGWHSFYVLVVDQKLAANRTNVGVFILSDPQTCGSDPSLSVGSKSFMPGLNLMLRQVCGASHKDHEKARAQNNKIVLTTNKY